MKSRLSLVTILLIVALVFVAGACAPGNVRWDSEMGAPANFWAGLWHGLIIIITFIVSLFTDTVKVYEVNNVGWGYNLGFLLGCMVSLGGGARAGCHKRKHDPDWDRVGRRIGDGIRDGLKSWRDDSRKADVDADWDELGRRIEERVREEMKKNKG
jgi:hypothetical protein